MARLVPPPPAVRSSAAPVALLAILVLLAGCAGVAPSDAPGAGQVDDGTGGTGGTDGTGESLAVTVTRVVDGDTVEVQYPNGTADTVRLVGVDTPEVHSENTPDEFEGVPETDAGRNCLGRWGERASSFAEERLADREVTLRFDSNLDRRGYYNRLLAYVEVGGETFNYQLVEQGYARVYDSDFSARARYEAAETAARQGGRGLWACATAPGATPTGTATQTASESGLVVADIHADAEGNDNENLDDEYVVLENRGDDPLDLSGWTVSDEAGKTYTFSDGFALDPGARVTLYTGRGSDTATARYWGRDGAVWNNGGDTVTVRDADGNVVAERSY